MPATNAPRTITTSAGNISLETEIVDSQRRRRQIPIVEVRVTILPGNVKAPDILFKHALQESYAAATNYLNIQPKPNSDTCRMLIKHDDLTSHNHMWQHMTLEMVMHYVNYYRIGKMQCNLVKKSIYHQDPLNLFFSMYLLGRIL